MKLEDLIVTLEFGNCVTKYQKKCTFFNVKEIKIDLH